MSHTTQARFNWRGFTSVTTALTFIGLAVSGIVLFFMPPGRIANWTGWTFAGLTKQQWGGLHIWFGILFIVIALLHIFFNWKCLVSYFKEKTRKQFALRLEWAASLILCVIVFIATINHAPPFESVLAWQESIKNSYNQMPSLPPVPHAELLTLDELAQQVPGVDTAILKANLEAQGILLNSQEETVGELADRYNKIPSEIFTLAVGNTRSGQNNQGAGGQGFGQMTLQDYCKQINMDTAIALDKLDQAGFKASADMTMRDIAMSAGKHPSELKLFLQ